MREGLWSCDRERKGTRVEGVGTRSVGADARSLIQRCGDGAPVRTHDRRNIGFRPGRKRGISPQRVEVAVAEPTQPAERMLVTHFIVSDDLERSRRFYTEVLGGTVVFGPEPTNVALANSFIIINGGGGPTDDKPTITLETPSDPDRVGASSISESQTSTPYTPSGAHGALSSLRRRSSTSTRSVATSEIPTVTSSRSGKPPIQRGTGRHGCGRQVKRP